MSKAFEKPKTPFLKIGATLKFLVFGTAHISRMDYCSLILGYDDMNIHYNPCNTFHVVHKYINA